MLAKINSQKGTILLESEVDDNFLHLENEIKNFIRKINSKIQYGIYDKANKKIIKNPEAKDYVNTFVFKSERDTWKLGVATCLEVSELVREQLNMLGLKNAVLYFCDRSDRKKEPAHTVNVFKYEDRFYIVDIKFDNKKQNLFGPLKHPLKYIETTAKNNNWNVNNLQWSNIPNVNKIGMNINEYMKLLKYEKYSKIVKNLGKLLLESDISDFKIYHVLPKEKLPIIKRDGILSPKALLEKHPDIFKKYSYWIYKERAARYLKKSTSKITNEDIIKYLDEARKPLDSTAIFFLFSSLNDAHHDIKRFTRNKVVLVEIDFNILSDPYLVFGRNVTKLNKDNFQDYKIEAEEQSKKRPSNSLPFSYIYHIASNEYQITPDKLKIIR